MFSEASVIVMDVQVSRKIQRHVEDRVKCGKCLECDQPIHRRGLCTLHYSRFRTALLEQPKSRRPSTEAKYIERGMIAGEGVVRQISVGNIYRDIAAEK